MRRELYNIIRPALICTAVCSVSYYWKRDSLISWNLGTSNSLLSSILWINIYALSYSSFIRPCLEGENREIWDFRTSYYIGLFPLFIYSESELASYVFQFIRGVYPVPDYRLYRLIAESGYHFAGMVLTDQISRIFLVLNRDERLQEQVLFRISDRIQLFVNNHNDLMRFVSDSVLSEQSMGVMDWRV